MNRTLIIFILSLIAAGIIYPFLHNEQLIHLFGNVASIVALIFAAINLNSARKLYDVSDAPRKAWTELAFGAFLWVIAQCLVLYYEIALKQVSHGTVADAFWMIGYIPLLIGVRTLLLNFMKTGLPLGSVRSYVLQGVIIAAVYFALFFAAIWKSVSATEHTLFIRMLDFLYPTFDFLLIAMISVLIRFSWILRGSSMAKSWILLCAGFTLIAIADIVLSSVLNFESPAYRLVDIAYFSSYFLIALAAEIQVRGIRAVHATV